MKFRWIESEKAFWDIAMMCRVLSVARSGFYAWRRVRSSARKLQDDSLKVRIRELHRTKECRDYGSPRMHQQLRRDGCRVGRKRVARLMAEDGIRGTKRGRKPKTTISLPHEEAAPNLLDRDFSAASPNTKWVTDVTAVWTREGWLYLAVILDLFSRRAVGWATSRRPDRLLCTDALKMAYEARRPLPGLIHHSDRGSTYTSCEYQALLDRLGLVSSMSRRGNCWDNAVAESFFGTMKVELGITGHEGFGTQAEARTALFEYIESHYNRRRLHSVLGYRPPAEYEALRSEESLAA